MPEEILPNLHQKHIKGTAAKAAVTKKRVQLCHLTNAVQRGLSLNQSSVYINTIVLKHLYDKRKAVNYDFLINNLHTITKYPDQIFKNKPNKRGDYCLSKNLKGGSYISVIELRTEKEEVEIATAFRTGNKYLKDFKKIWEWKGK